MRRLLHAFEQPAHVLRYAFCFDSFVECVRDEWQCDGGVAVADGACSGLAVDFTPAYGFFQRATAQATPLWRVGGDLDGVLVWVIVFL